VKKTSGRRPLEQFAKLLLRAVESESYALGCQAQGVCDLGARLAVNAALMEHLGTELRDRRRPAFGFVLTNE
jgi:hypothetical protein